MLMLLVQEPPCENPDEEVLRLLPHLFVLDSFGNLGMRVRETVLFTVFTGVTMCSYAGRNIILGLPLLGLTPDLDVGLGKC